MPKSSNWFKKFFKPTKSKKDAQEIVAEQGPKQFSFKTLSSATEGFHAKNKLGKGGFAQVYKGKLNDGREMAVKRPLQISDKEKELVLNELELLLGSAHHRNIVKFLGFCSHGEEMLLVFEFASNGSLDHLLFNSEAGRADALDWKRTYAIIIGVARALLYLHEQSHSVIVHCDIKPANILIDENWVPKIADFGTANLLRQDQTHVNISEAAGTLGYSAPEYKNYGHVSPKADTYSFGVVALELISGQKNWLSHARSSNAQGLRDSANELYKEGNISQFMDRKLIPSAVLDQVQFCVQIGVMCTQFDLELRPTMGRVNSMLSENYSSSTLVDEPMRHGSSSSSSSSSSSTAQISSRKELGNNGSSGTDIHLENDGLPIHRRLTRSRRIKPEDVQSYIPSISGSSYSSLTQLTNNGSSSGPDIHLENESLPKHHRLTRSRRIQPEDVQSYIPSIPSSSCSSSGNGIQIEPEEGLVRATIQEVAAAAEEEDEEGIPIPMITKEDPIETMGKFCPRKTSARQSREKTPLPPPHMTKQTKEAAKKVAKQQQPVEEEADEKSPTTLNDTEEWPVSLTPEDKVIVPEIKVDKERLAANDAKEHFWQAITKQKILKTSFKKSLNDEGNKSSWCEEGFFEEGDVGKYKDQLTNPQDAIFMNNWEGILRKVGVAEDSLLFSEVPLSGLVEQPPPTTEEAVDDGDHGGGSVADSNG